eukprot:Gb_29838 [translate_table: standard]
MSFCVLSSNAHMTVESEIEYVLTGFLMASGFLNCNGNPPTFSLDDTFWINSFTPSLQMLTMLSISWHFIELIVTACLEEYSVGKLCLTSFDVFTEMTSQGLDFE